MKKEIELLAPAKSFESMLTAYKAGADAVYAGGQKFSARAFANNFEISEIIEAVKVSHLFGKKFYLAVNTILKEKEISRELFEYIKPLYENGLDACIIQDIGVFNFLHKYFPEMDIHISTQASITNYMGAKFYEELGAKRIVTAREMQLKDIIEIRENTDLEIESFVHGALCYSYSGQCLFSSMLGSRSGNRGRCAQPCRLPYDVYSEDGTKLNKKALYPLSLKDICTIEFIPQLIEAGINSFKIEGRMKSQEYVATVTSIYRKYIDLAMSGKKYEIEDRDNDDLLTIYNRGGFSKSYYSGVSDNMISVKGNTKLGNEVKNNIKLDSLKCRMNEKYIQPKLKKDINFYFSAKIGEKITLVAEVDGIYAVEYGDIVEQANNTIVDINKIKDNILALGNSEFNCKNIDFDIDENAFIALGRIKKMRRDVLEKLKEQFTVKRGSLYTNNKKVDFNFNKEKAIYVSINYKNQYEAVKKYDFDYLLLNTATLSEEDIKNIIEDNKKNKEYKIFLELPVIFKEEHIKFINGFNEVYGIVIKNAEMWQYYKLNDNKKKALLYFNMPCNNTYGLNLAYENNIDNIVYPLEITQKENFDIGYDNGINYVYGYVPLMITKQKASYAVKSANDDVHLTDRKGISFCMKSVDDGNYSIIYNSVPTFTADIISYKDASILIDFTIEDKKVVSEIIGNILADKKDFLKNFTRGHIKRSID